MGTNGDGVFRYDGKSLTYFSPEKGFGSSAVRELAEDKSGNLWFGTDGGVSKYDGKQFTNFTVKEGLISNDVWSLLIDRSGSIWVGTLEGVCRYNGKSFSNFPIPPAVDRDFSRGVTSTKVIWDIKRR